MIPKFHLDWLKWGNTLTLLGMRGSGKTTFMLELIQHFDADLNLLFAGSDGSYDEFCQVSSPLFVFDAFTNVAIVDKVLGDLMTLVKEKNLQRPAKILVLLDDLGMEDAIMKNKILLSLYSRGRHLNKVNGKRMGITVIIAIQEAKMIGPKMRGNTDFLMCHMLPNIESIRKVHKEYTNIPEFAVFNKIYDDLNDQKEFAILVVNNQASARKKGQKLSWHVATPVTRRTHIGSHDVNDLTDRVYDPSFTREVSLPPPVTAPKSRSRKATAATEKTVFGEE